MIQSFLFALIVAASSVASAVPLTPHQAQDMMEYNNSVDRRPRYCWRYDRRLFFREMRQCGDDRRCRWQVRRKGEPCGY